ncbi:MAG: hypothetical protein K9M75_12465 [Phycisphaerae bacterium]|nr:hypothetical protein [Phycisphaerae bacterium]
MEETKPEMVKNSKCKLCGHITATLNAMRVHLNKTHGKSGRGIAKNYISKTTAPTSPRGGRAKGSKNKTKTSNYECTICGHTCGTDAGIIGHLQAKHEKSGSMREFYKKTELPAKRKYTKRDKPNRSNVMEMLQGAGVMKKDIKFKMTVDLEINLSKNSIEILPWAGNKPEGA